MASHDASHEASHEADRQASHQSDTQPAEGYAVTPATDTTPSPVRGSPHPHTLRVPVFFGCLLPLPPQVAEPPRNPHGDQYPGPCVRTPTAAEVGQVS